MGVQIGDTTNGSYKQITRTISASSCKRYLESSQELEENQRSLLRTVQIPGTFKTPIIDDCRYTYFNEKANKF